MAAGAIIVVSRVAKLSPAWPRLMPEQSRVTLDTERELRFTTVKDKYWTMYVVKAREQTAGADASAAESPVADLKLLSWPGQPHLAESLRRGR